MEWTPQQLATVAGIIGALVSAFYMMVRQQGKSWQRQIELGERNFAAMVESVKEAQTNPELVTLLGKTFATIDAFRALIQSLETTINLNIQAQIKYDEQSAQRFEQMQQLASMQSAAQVKLLHEISSAVIPVGQLLHTQTEQISEVSRIMTDDNQRFREQLDRIEKILGEIKRDTEVIQRRVEYVEHEASAMRADYMKRITDEQAARPSPPPAIENFPPAGNMPASESSSATDKE